MAMASVAAAGQWLGRGAGANRIDLRVAASAANYDYAGTSQQGDGLAVCGLGAAPVLSASSGGVSAEDRLAAI